MLYFLRYIKGYVNVLFYGDAAERILNLCAKNRISLWGSRLKNGNIEANLYMKDFYRLKAIMFRSGIRLKIQKKCGLPIKISKNKKRIGIVVGVLVFFCIIRFMSGYIWIIDVDGNKSVSRAEILQSCKEIGITSGVKKDSINPKSDRERLLMHTDKLAWASLNIEGCKLTVNVSEVKKDSANEEPQNLKAKADGIIEKIDVTSGNCVVKTGDTVKKGDLLVSGILEKADSTKFISAKGEVTAKTKRIITVSGEFKKNITAKTGKSKNKKVLRIFSLYIPLYLGQETDEYMASTRTKTLKILGKNLPIEIYEKKFEYTENYTKTLSEEQLCAQLQEKLKKILEDEGIDDYSVENTEYINTNDGITLKATVNAVENIAESEEILVKNQSLE